MNIVLIIVAFILGYQCKKHNLRPRSKTSFEIHNVYSAKINQKEVE
jgi:hypothetical protein